MHDLSLMRHLVAWVTLRILIIGRRRVEIDVKDDLLPKAAPEKPERTMRLEPLGDQAVLTYCVDENAASALARAIRRAPPSWCVDVVQAYVSVAVYYDGVVTNYAQAAAVIRSDFADAADAATTDGRLITIPCCYDLGLDFDRITQHTGLNRERIIALHGETIYTIYAIGFCPGFPYLGYLPPELAGVPRLESPRLLVEAGSVGMTGRQTGIYTEARPGGWNILGRTPLTLVDVATEYFPLTTGDRVRFAAIDLAEYERLRGSNCRLRLSAQVGPAER